MPYGKTFIRQCLSVFTVVIFLYPANVCSTPREVTFFPDSAHVHEVAKITLHSESKDIRKGIIILPGHADPDSLVVSLVHNSTQKIEDMMWRQVVRQDDAKIANLRKQLDNLKNEKKVLQSSIRALDTQVQFWQLQTKAKAKTVTDAYNLSAAIGKSIKNTYHEKLSQESELEKLDKRIKFTQDEFDRTAGMKETAWEITLLISGSKSSDTTLSYTYSLSECGWQPLYRLEAKPQDKKIDFTWEAEIWQSSGQDWSNASIQLATLKPPKSTSPSD
ncbi:MAG: DUF4139 domain-containing protein, partial [Syntrophaceae bacterium]|nr:DUF4139 domain-containing protein [Syntrophaceae bacterium]